ncbi:MAG TPA: GDSL family lipase [Lentisphaeria bacterium]|nr:MAG: GDSL family lipase [Lentisphaerae bacterium GWF2_50_93]HCE46021.1 GDSL family lipase [Lentisphaeria bacterium]
MKIKPGSKLIMIGDSITDCGRAQPVAEGLFDPLGRGYVNIVSALIGATYPEYRTRIVNVGCSGNNVKSLKDRWRRDVIDLKPDWVSIMIGINDVWRQFDLPLMKEQHVMLDEYEETLDRLVATTLRSAKGVVLMAPYYIEPNRNDAMRARMDEYGAVVKKVAIKRKTLFADTQAAFDTILETCHPAALAWDRVHPNQIGHAVIARAFLDAVGFEWNRHVG